MTKIKSTVSKIGCLLFIVCIAACKNKNTIRQPLSSYAPGNSGILKIDSLLNNIPVSKDTSHNGMVWIKGGDFIMGAGAAEGYAEEYPQHKVAVNSFWMDAHEVTNAEFAAFINATGYSITAERKPDWEVLQQQLPAGTPKPHDSLLTAGSLVFTPSKNSVPLNDASQWWRFVKDANWKQPEGPLSNLNGKENHPVVQVSWEDAMAYCNGRANVYQQRQNGSGLQRAAIAMRCIAGGMQHQEMIGCLQTFGREIFLTTILCRIIILPQHLLKHLRQILLACMI